MDSSAMFFVQVRYEGPVYVCNVSDNGPTLEFGEDFPEGWLMNEHDATALCHGLICRGENARVIRLHV